MKTLRKCTCIGRVVRDEILVTKYMVDLTCPRARDLTRERTRGDRCAFSVPRVARARPRERRIKRDVFLCPLSRRCAQP
jgi:hypothetical protein